MVLGKGNEVVGVVAVAVVGHVAHAFKFRDARQQRLLDAFLEGDISLPAALATAAELQHGNALVDHVDQRDLATVAGQPGFISVCR
ncbi:hypothetical protein SSTU70S_00249 [Stutzerimonas stutzeri]